VESLLVGTGSPAMKVFHKSKHQASLVGAQNHLAAKQIENL
jgi:hypothetical protein